MPGKGQTMSLEQRALRSRLMSGPGNHRWKGGRREMANGYVASGKRGLEHRSVLGAHIGRALLAREQVHHVNEIRSDNRPLNLWLFPNDAAHSEWHRMKRSGAELSREMSAVPLSWAT